MKILWLVVISLTIFRFAYKLDKNKLDLLSLFTFVYLLMIV